MIGEEHDFRPVISKLIVRHDRDKWWNNSKVVASFVKQASNQCMQVNDFTFIFCIITRCSRVDLGMTESWGWCPRILWFSISFKHRFDFCRWTCGYAILFQTTAVSEFSADYWLLSNWSFIVVIMCHCDTERLKLVWQPEVWCGSSNGSFLRCTWRNLTM